jgi:hypothetical protein
VLLLDERQCGLTVGCLADDVDAGFLEQASKPSSIDLVIVDE